MLGVQRLARSGAGFITAVVLLGVYSIALGQGRPGVPIVNYADRPISTPSGKLLSAATVREILVSAGDRYEWTFTDVGPDRLLGTQSWRDKHSIEVEITYSPERYSIRYRNSKNMNYEVRYDASPTQSFPEYSAGPAGRSNSNTMNVKDGTPTIHPEYNKHVRQLVDRFEFELRKR